MRKFELNADLDTTNVSGKVLAKLPEGRFLGMGRTSDERVAVLWQVSFIGRMQWYDVVTGELLGAE